jgi:hypothetical protein
LVGSVEDPAVWLDATRIGSSLSASFSRQLPLKFTPCGGAMASLSPAQADKTRSAKINPNRMRAPLDFEPAGDESAMRRRTMTASL